MLLLFTSLCLSITYEKTICVCSKCGQSDACKGMPSVDPFSDTFYEDYFAARSNSKDIKLLFDDNNAISVPIHLKILNGQNIYMLNLWRNDVKLDLIYDNGEDYTSCNFVFNSTLNVGNIKANFKSSKTGEEEVVINFGHVATVAQNTVTFEQSAPKITFMYRSADMRIGSFFNLTKVVHTSSDINKITIGEDDDNSEVTFSKTKNTFTIKNDDKIKLVEVQYHKEDKLSLSTQQESLNARKNIILNIENGVAMNDMPKLAIDKFKKLEIKGELWAVSDPNLLIPITEVENLIINSKEAPFQIVSDYISIEVSSSTKFYGNITAATKSKVTLKLKYSLSKRIQIECLDTVSGDVSVQSPFIDLSINKYFATISDRGNYFPVEGSMSQNEISHVVIKSISFSDSNPRPALRVFKFLNFFSVLPTNEELQKIMNGVNFLQIPESSIRVFDYEFEFSRSESPEEGFPGFSENQNVMIVKMTKIDGKFSFDAIAKNSPFDIYPYYLCFGDWTGNCENFMDYRTNSIKDIEASAGLNLGEIIPSGYKKVIIGFKTEEVTIDISKLSGNVKNIELLGEEYEGTQFKIIGENVGSKILIIKELKFMIDSMLKVDNITMIGCNFVENIDLELPLHTCMDLKSLKNLLKRFSNAQFKNIYVLGTTNYDPSELKFGNEKWYLDSTELGYNNIANNGNLTFINQNGMTISLHSSFTDKTIVTKKTKIQVIKENDFKVEGDGWKKDNFPGKIEIDHGDIKLPIKFTKQNQNDCFEIKGKGPVDVTIDYGDQVVVCVYDPDHEHTCKSSFNQHNIQNNETELIKDITGTNILVTVDPSSSAVDFDFSIFDNKYFSIRSSSEDKCKVNIIFDTDSIEPFYSKLEFGQTVVLSTNGSSGAKQFGELVLNECELTADWKSVNVKVTRFICDFKYLKMFGSIHIMDQIRLNGDIPTEPATIEFTNDEDANDLVIELSSNVNIIVKENEINVGTQIFKITQSNNYDVLLNIKKAITMTIDCQTSKQVPRISLDFGNTASTLKFTGTWPTIESSDNSLVQIISTGLLTINLNGNVPLSTVIPNSRRFETIIKFILSASSKIHFLAANINDEKTMHYIVESSDTQNDFEFIVTNGILMSEFSYYNDYDLIRIHSSNIHMQVAKIDTMKIPEFDVYIQFDFSISPTSTSSIEILEELHEYLIIYYIINIKSDIFGKINEDDFGFFKRTNTLVKAKAVNLKHSSLELVYLENNNKNEVRAHGFDANHNCLELKIVDDDTTYSQIIIRNAILPSQLPYIIEITDKVSSSKAELPVSVSGTELASLGDKLPNKINDIQVNVVAKPEFTIDPKALMGGKDVHILIKGIGVNKLELSMKQPQDQSIDLYLSNFKLTLVAANSKASIVAKKIGFNNIDFVTSDFTIDDKVNALTVDADSLNSLIEKNIMTSFKNNLEIKDANIIEFTKDGWIFAENVARNGQEVKLSEFTKMKVQSKPAIQLIITDDKLTTLKGLSISTDKQDDGSIMVEFSRYWQNITSIDPPLKITTTANRVKVLSASFPTVSPIESFFEIDPSNVDVKFETDNEGKFDYITFAKGQIINNIMKFDLIKLSPQYRTVIGEQISFIDNSGIIFVNDIGTFDGNEITIKEKAKTKFSNISASKIIINKGSELEGSVFLKDAANIDLHWDLDSSPSISLTSPLTTVPTLVIKYDMTDVDEEKYISKLLKGDGFILMQGQFQCDAVIKLSKFSSNLDLFNDGDANVLKLECLSSSRGKVLNLKGARSFPKPDDDASKQGNKNALTPGGTVGVVIACVVVAVFVVGLIIYIRQRKKIDQLKNKIPYAETRTSDFEETSNTKTHSDNSTKGDSSDGFDD